LAKRFACVSIAPFGCPVVPEVYWMTARSSTEGRGGSAAMRGALSSFSQDMVPGAGCVSFARVALSFFRGSCSARRFTVGNALRRLTATM